jgi:hypothetical protein
MTRDAAPAEENDTPVIRVIRGVPTAEELAALVGVLAVRSAAQVPESARAQTPLWRRREAVTGSKLSAGLGAWRASGLPL